MQIFIDLDGVIFNTVDMIESFKALLVESGIAKERVHMYYEQCKSPSQYRSRTFYLIREPYIMKKVFGIKSDKHVVQLMQAIDSFLDTSVQFVFNDAMCFLKKFKDKNLILVSYGGTEWQNLKVDKAGLRGYFREIIVTHGVKKPDALREFQCRSYADLSNSFFVDDRGKEIDLMKGTFPSITTFLMIRPNGRFNHEKCESYDYIVNDLSAVEQIIMTRQ